MVTRLISAHACRGKGLRLDSGDFAHISRVFLNAAGTDHVWKFSPLNNFNYCQLASAQAPGHQWATQVIGHATIWLATELDKEMMDQQGLPSACSYSMVAVKERCMSGCGFQFVTVQFRFYSVCVLAHMHQLSNDDKCTCKFIYVTTFETHMLYLLTCRLRFLWGISQLKFLVQTSRRSPFLLFISKGGHRPPRWCRPISQSWKIYCC